MYKILQKFGFLLINLIAVSLILYGSTVYQTNLNQKNLNKKINNLEIEINKLKQNKILGEKTNLNDCCQASSTQNESIKKNNSQVSRLKASQSNNSNPVQQNQNLNPEQSQNPTIPINTAWVEILGYGKFEEEINENDTAFTLLLRAAQNNQFEVKYKHYEGLGAFIECLAKICSHDNYYWAFYYNGKYAEKGVSSQEINNKDIISFKLETW